MHTNWELLKKKKKTYIGHLDFDCWEIDLENDEKNSKAFLNLALKKQNTKIQIYKIKLVAKILKNINRREWI